MTALALRAKACFVRMPWLARAAGHVLACIAYPLLWGLAWDIYTGIYGVPRRTGYALGMTLHFLLNLFVVLNLVLIFVSNLKARLAATVLMTAVVLVWLLPDHPLRGTLTAGLNGGLMLLAVALDIAYRAMLRPREPR